jgi:hypothetical protein
MRLWLLLLSLLLLLPMMLLVLLLLRLRVLLWRRRTNCACGACSWWPALWLVRVTPPRPTLPSRPPCAEALLEAPLQRLELRQSRPLRWWHQRRMLGRPALGRPVFEAGREKR